MARCKKPQLFMKGKCHTAACYFFAFSCRHVVPPEAGAYAPRLKPPDRRVHLKMALSRATRFYDPSPPPAPTVDSFLFSVYPHSGREPDGQATGKWRFSNFLMHHYAAYTYGNADLALKGFSPWFTPLGAGAWKTCNRAPWSIRRLQENEHRL